MRQLNSLSDAELLLAFKNGHQKAFDILLMRYKADVQRTIMHYIKDTLVAEDLAQEAFIKIYTSLQAGKYNEEGKFLPWSLRIARNLCMDHLRKAKHRPVLHYDVNNDAEKMPGELCAENRMIKHQQDCRLHDLITNLSEDQRQVVAHRYFEDLSFKEISARMNTSINTSVGRMRYALMNLRKKIDDDRSFGWY